MFGPPTPPALEDIVRSYRPNNPNMGEIHRWISDCVPTFRIHLTIGPTGERLAFGSFRYKDPGASWPARIYRFEGSGEWAEGEVIIAAGRKLRELMGAPIAGANTRSELERAIVAARAAGRHPEADQLEAELLAARAGG